MNIKKIIVPPFADKWIKENNNPYWWKVIAKWEMKVPDEDREVFNWYSDYNEDDFILAWITGIYKIEEEPKFYVEFPVVRKQGKNQLLCCFDGIIQIDFSSTKYVNNNQEYYTFTEREIKAIDEKYWDFAVPIEEDN